MTAFSLRRIISSLEQHQLVRVAASDLPESINGICDDSRQVAAGSLFVAVRGVARDGHDFLAAARERGATAAIVEDGGLSSMPSIVVHDSRMAAAVAAATFHNFPSRDLTIVGATGTNGKTTTVNLLRHILARGEARAASIGTLGVVLEPAPTPEGNHPQPAGAGLTTPGAIELQRLLRSLVWRGVSSVAMEVSSHSLHQRRVDCIEFDAAVFTNLSRDHMDYHGSMESYFAAKSRLLDLLAPDGAAVVNADDLQWNALPLGQSARLVRYSAEDNPAEVRARNVVCGEQGSSWTLELDGQRAEVRLPLLGAFNVSNALAAAAAAWALGLSPGSIADALSNAPQVSGRMERLLDSPVVLRDYAHTPDALERALLSVMPFAPGGVLLVFGCGGDRDRGKRPEMGRIAAQLARSTIITSDNPRMENPEAILDQIASGMSGALFERIEDRRAAIARAIERARRTGELVLLAGKGHETYQIRGSESLDFDEKVIVNEIAGRVG